MSCLIDISWETSTAGLEYRRERVDRGVETYSKLLFQPRNIKNARFYTFQLDHYGLTYQRTDGQMDGPSLS